METKVKLQTTTTNSVFLYDVFFVVLTPRRETLDELGADLLRDPLEALIRQRWSLLGAVAASLWTKATEN